MAVQLARRLINVEEYYSMSEAGILTEKERVELIHGEIIEMSPIGKKHSSVVMRLINILSKVIDDKALLNAQNPIRINDLNEPEPDLTILKARDDFYADAHPSPKDIIAVIEVSDSTYEYDKQIKLPLYASAEIPEFWIVNINKNEIEIHRNPSHDIYKNIEIIQKGDKIDLSFGIKSIGAKDILG